MHSRSTTTAGACLPTRWQRTSKVAQPAAQPRQSKLSTSSRVVDVVESCTTEQCGSVALDQLAALTGFDAVSITTNRAPDQFPSRWDHPERLGLSFRFGAVGFNYADAVGNAPDSDRQGELGILAVGSAVFYDARLQAGDVRGFTVNDDTEGWFAAADAIAVNLVQQIEKPTPL